jgi:hypothetical protein
MRPQVTAGSGNRHALRATYRRYGADPALQGDRARSVDLLGCQVTSSVAGVRLAVGLRPVSWRNTRWNCA